MFDKEQQKRNRKKSANFIQSSEFYKFIYEDIIDRIEPIDKEFREILVIGDQINLTKRFSKCKQTNITSYDQIDSASNKFDLIIFPFALHWIMDIQGFFRKIHDILTSDGIFICNFSGGGTLRNLRKTLVELEAENSLPHSPHISPLIQFDQVTQLLQHSGFAENIIDMEPLELEYESPLKLMKALKNAGESNVLEGRMNYSITKSMYNSLIQKTNAPFIDHVNLITLLSSKTKNTIKLKSV